MVGEFEVEPNAFPVDDPHIGVIWPIHGVSVPNEVSELIITDENPPGQLFVMLLPP